MFPFGSSPKRPVSRSRILSFLSEKSGMIRFLFILFWAIPFISMAQSAPLVTGPDHVPVAVSDLESAAARFRKLGFALKEGRPHDNGIRNRHIKFRNGTEMELITAPEAKDELTANYRRLLVQGDGPAYLAFLAPDRATLRSRLDAAGIPHTGDSFRGALDTYFLGSGNQSPTDKPEHFAHANGAESLIGVWLAPDDPKALRELLHVFGGTTTRETVRIPAKLNAEVTRFRDGEIVLLPASYQRLAHRPIIGATLRVKSLKTTRALFEQAGIRPVAAGKSLFLSPEQTAGFWLEFREVPERHP